MVKNPVTIKTAKKATVIKKPPTKFQLKAPKVMHDLMAEFELDKLQAAGILGNIGVECDGFKAYHEYGQPEGKGGYGWCQWTGPRRKDFFSFCDTHNLDRITDEASYRFLVHELSTKPYSSAVAALHKTTTLADAVLAFERNFEKAGSPNYVARNNYAKIALAAFDST
jgi:hypothetical protein